MNSAYLVILFLPAITACKSYDNKSNYKLQIGQSAEIYYSTNSCCYYCISNEKALRHVKLLQIKEIEKDPEGCEGCDHTSAFVFQAKSKGTDTVKLKSVTANTNCSTYEIEPEVYVIEVK